MTYKKLAKLKQGDTVAMFSFDVLFAIVRTILAISTIYQATILKFR